MKRDFSIAVKAVIIKDNKALCLIRSDREINESRLNSIDLWDLPGGGLQFFEKLNLGLQREIKEETKLEVDILMPINAHDIIRPSLHIVFITYLCEYISGEVELSAEHKDYKWISEDELADAPIQKWLKKIMAQAFAEYKNRSKIDPASNDGTM